MRRCQTAAGATTDRLQPEQAWRGERTPRLVFRTPNLWCAVTESHRKPLTILCARPSLDPTDWARVRKMSLESHQVREVLSTIHCGALALSGLVESVLTATRIQTGQFQLRAQA